MLDIKKLIKVCSVRRFGSQDIIFEEGDQGSEMFIILSGSVNVLITAPNGNKIKIALLKAGDIFGEMSLFEGLHRSATVQAIEETITIAVNESNFESVIFQEPSLALRIMKSLSERIRRQNAELAKYRDQPCPKSQPLDTSPLPTTVESKEESLDDTPDYDDFSNLRQHIAKYNEAAPSNHSAYLFDKKIVCPVCEQKIDVQLIRSSKLRLKQTEPDYRQIYEDIDILWYIVWVCPHCYYANFNTDFQNISDQEKKRIKELSSKAKDTFGPLNGPFSLTLVLTEYYLTLYWLQQLGTSPDFEKLGKLWLRISWLYSNVQETEMSMECTRKALGYFENFLNGLTEKTTAAQDQYLYLLVGELSLKLGNIAEARNYFRQSIVVKGGNERMKQQAQNRIQELRSLV